MKSACGPSAAERVLRMLSTSHDALRGCARRGPSAGPPATRGAAAPQMPPVAACET
jgi:hypothetical protein